MRKKYFIGLTEKQQENFEKKNAKTWVASAIKVDGCDSDSLDSDSDFTGYYEKLDDLKEDLKSLGFIGVLEFRYPWNYQVKIFEIIDWVKSNRDFLYPDGLEKLGAHVFIGLRVEYDDAN